MPKQADPPRVHLVGGGSQPSLSLRDRLAWRARLFKLGLKEHLVTRSVLFHTLVGGIGLIVSWIYSLTGRIRQSFLLLCKLHRTNFLRAADRRAERFTREMARAVAKDQPHPIRQVLEQHVSELPRTPQNGRFLDRPGDLLGPLTMVLKSHTEKEKGVLLLQYSYTFPLFLKKFNAAAIAERYHIVLEPDWSGYCDPNILCFACHRFPVFVQAYEPRDRALIESTNSNLIPVATSANWWIDHRVYRPLPEVRKDVDVVMVAGWGSYKRHWRFFAALSRLRKAGRKLKVLLIGYPLDMTLASLMESARYYDVTDQLEVHEWVPYDDVNALVNRGKVAMLWSLREGVNRAIIEAMFADVPCVVREGFNYGYSYPYVNSHTGCFANERTIDSHLVRMIENPSQFSPREWVMNYMSCQRAAETLSEAIGRVAADRGEPWSGGVAVKVNKLHGMEYWDPTTAIQFDADYAFLRSTIR